MVKKDNKKKWIRRILIAVLVILALMVLSYYSTCKSIAALPSLELENSCNDACDSQGEGYFSSLHYNGCSISGKPWTCTCTNLQTDTEVKLKL